MPDDPNFWNAGNIGCGELLMHLKKKLSVLPPETEFTLIASDAGAEEDIPAWANLTGNTLVRYNHPEYILRTKK